MHNPSYITKNRFGIYYFQYSYTDTQNSNSDSVKKRKLIRKSLRTRNKNDALHHAKHLWILMTKIYKKYFTNPELYATAMKLVAQYEFAEEKGWDSVNDFLSELDDDDCELLRLGEKQRDEDLLNSKKQTQKNSELKLLDKKSPYLSELTKKWLSEKERIVKASTMASYRNQIALFCEVITELNKEDVRIKNLSTELIREFNAVLNQLPANRNAKIYQGKTFVELAKMQVKKISSKTYHYYINVVIEFLTWCEAQGYIENTKFKTILQSSKKSIPKKGKYQRVNFDKSDLKKIFESKHYLSGSFKRATDYWIPLLALFTGARLGEICQLKVSDIKKVDEIYCIDINEDDEDKSIKRESSARMVPIHNQLLNLGFIDFVNNQKKKKQKNLFEINYGIIRGQYHSVQKQMGAYLNKVGIKSVSITKKKSFHSFRHTIRTQLTELDIEERTIDAIIGHASEARSIGNKIYTHSKLIKQKQSALQKLVYDIDFSKIKHWNECKFAN